MRKFIFALIAFYLLCVSFSSFNKIDLKVHDRKAVDTNLYDTVWISSYKNYYIADDSTVKMSLITDTFHSIDSSVPTFPINSIRIIKIEKITR